MTATAGYLSIRDVNKVYGAQHGEATTALESISLEVKQGEFLAVLGSPDTQLTFSKAKGSVPIRTDVDVSSLTPMVRWLVRCLMKKARPIARGETRFIEGPPSAVALTTRRSSRSRTW